MPAPRQARPVAHIDAPADTAWASGEALTFSGGATDAEDGVVDALSWTVLLLDCDDAGVCDTRTVATADGPGITFSGPDHARPATLEVRLTATDSGGRRGTASVSLTPRTTALPVDGNVPGVRLDPGTGAMTAPSTVAVTSGATAAVSAPPSQVVDGVTYTFARWSDGGAATHDVAVGATALTLTATYTDAGTAFDGRDIGAPALAGSTVVVGDTVTVTGAGTDIGGTADQFHFASQALPGDGATVVTRPPRCGPAAPGGGRG